MSASRNVLFASAAGVAVTAGWILGSRPQTNIRLAFLAVGQGDCAVLQDGKSGILIDDGPTESAARFTIIPALRSMGVSEVQTIFLSHPDQDHIAGTRILKERFPGATIAMSEGFKTNTELLDHFRSWHIDPNEVQWLPRRSRGSFGPFSLDIYCPEVTPATPDNDGSMIVKMVSAQASAVFSGDGSAEEEVAATPVGDWSAEVMHAGHHGSKTASSFPWLTEVHPQFVVISCGRDNRYGHPHKEALDRISTTGAKVLRTDQDGTISFTLRHGEFELDRP